MNINGDSDSVASIVGNVLGACWGMCTIPRGWMDRVVQKDAINNLITWSASRLGL